jgi:hypothetical protein
MVRSYQLVLLMTTIVFPLFSQQYEKNLRLNLSFISAPDSFEVYSCKIRMEQLFAQSKVAILG